MRRRPNVERLEPAAGQPSPGEPCADRRDFSRVRRGHSAPELAGGAEERERTLRGVEALNSAVADVKKNLEAARTSKSSVLRPELEQVTTALDALQSATTDVTKDNLAQKAPQIATALAQVATAAASFTAALSKSCPAS